MRVRQHGVLFSLIKKLCNFKIRKTIENLQVAYGIHATNVTAAKLHNPTFLRRPMTLPSQQ